MDFGEKRQIIQNIADEVKILHPLLDHLLRNIEGVTGVEYKHGPNEKGADFIVTRRDVALERDVHIGVIAKKGKILSNFDDIARQIEECRMPRTMLGGRKEGRLSDVWVINTSSISQNAQDKILDTYAKQSIQFIDGEKLTELVDKYADYFWHSIPSPVGSYLQEVSKRIEQLDQDLSVVKNLGCDNFFIDPDVQEYEKPQYIKSYKPKPPRFVNLIEEVVRHKVCSLEAEMGYGKSKVARHVALHYCAPERYKHISVIPIFSTFRRMAEHHLSLTEYLKIETGRYGDFLAEEQNKILFIVDGVDEAIGKISGWDVYLKDIIREAKCTNNFYLLLTSRPLRALDESVSAFVGSNRLILRPLSLNKLVNFIEKATEKLSISRRIFEDLRRSDLFKQLPQSPIAAALLSRLLAQNTNDLPSNLTELYSKSIENLLGRWDIDKGGCTEKEFKDAEQAVLIIADYLINNRLIYIGELEAREMVADWHKKRNTNVPLDTLFDRVFEKSGLLSIDKETGTVSFSHRSFGEYLYALKNVRSHSLIDPAESFDPYWVYIQFFQTGLMRDCEDHLKQLLAFEPDDEIRKWLKVIFMPEFILAGYQTDYSVVENNIYKLFISAANLYLDILKGGSATPLTELPEMHLLWFFQRIIRGAYGFDYFEKAITSTILNIDQSILDQDSKMYALFFASCYAAEFGDASGFEYLSRNYGAHRLPLPVSIAMRLEQETNKDFSKLPLLKEHEKRLNNILKHKNEKSKIDSIAGSKAIDDLFDKPIKSK
ncbi:MAG: NACHT domain-containing protein [Pseudomonadota bacterium]